MNRMRDTGLEAREKSRDNRMEGSAKAQNAVIHQNKIYDLEIDTSKLGVEECANKIIAAIQKNLLT